RPAEPLTQKLNLRGFAAAFRALESDEEASHGRVVFIGARWPTRPPEFDAPGSKSEIRRPKSERSPKSETENRCAIAGAMGHAQFGRRGALWISSFGFPSDFDIRISDLETRIPAKTAKKAGMALSPLHSRALRRI